MPSLDAEVGGAAANAFTDADVAAEYLDNRLNAGAWTGASSADRERALIEATTELNLLTWTGSRVDDVQALSWPRAYAVNPDAAEPLEGSSWPVYFEEDEIPSRLVRATIELALEFLRSGSTDLAAADRTIGIIRKKVDVLETEYAPSAQRAQGLARFPRVLALIGPLLDSAATGGLELVRT